jgi:hypothetical protein
MASVLTRKPRFARLFENAAEVKHFSQVTVETSRKTPVS